MCSNINCASLTTIGNITARRGIFNTINCLDVINGVTYNTQDITYTRTLNNKYTSIGDSLIIGKDIHLPINSGNFNYTYDGNTYNKIPFSLLPKLKFLSDVSGTTIQKQINNLSNISRLSYAPKDSPVFVGVPTAPTPKVSDNSDTLATTSFVKNVIGLNNVVNSSSPIINDNLTLSTKFTKPKMGQLGYQFYGNLYGTPYFSDGNHKTMGGIASNAFESKSQASIILQPGVWLIMSTLYYLSIDNTTCGICISPDKDMIDNTGFHSASTGVNLGECSVSSTRAVTITKETIYYVNSYCSQSLTGTVTPTCLDKIILYALRIA